MPELKLKFHIDLTWRSRPWSLGEIGPLFHKWMPDGKNDAITLSNPGEQEQLTVWFERRMIDQGGFLRWKHDGSAMRTIGALMQVDELKIPILTNTNSLEGPPAT